MADALMRDAMRVEQTLHGYSEGHRLIAASAKLEHQDARIMLVLSDASGSGSRISSNGYLTGYPLPAAGRFVLARTWSAPEMGRPGCVWTHSLLVDFADLARLQSADELVARFVRPSAASMSEFGSTLDMHAGGSAARVPAAAMPRVAKWVGAMYGRPRNKIFAERDGAGDDALVLAMWMQQWPRLRRSLRFCTQVVEDRSGNAEPFDFQLVDGKRSGSQLRTSSGLFASDAESDDRLVPLLEDLADPDGTGLRGFLREVGGDVGVGRAAMLPIVRLFGVIGPGSRTDEIAEVVADWQALGANQGRVGRAAIARLVLSRPDVIDEDLFDFALAQVQDTGDLPGIVPAALGMALLRRRPWMFGSDLPDNSSLKAAVKAAIETADADDLAAALSRHVEALVAILPERPDVLGRRSLWEMRPQSVTRLLATVDPASDRAADVVAAVMAAGRDDLAKEVVGRFGSRSAIRVLLEPGHPITPAWLGAIASRPDELATCMSDGMLRDRAFLIPLCRKLEPDGVPNEIGEDPWVTALRDSQTSADIAGEDTLAAFLFCRAMGWRSRSPGRLFSLSMQRLHEATAMDRVHGDERRLAEQRLPWVASWRAWDRCARIRHAVVDQFLDRTLPPREFGAVVEDDDLWMELVRIAADSSRGRRYLERVRYDLLDASHDRWRRRADLLRLKSA